MLIAICSGESGLRSKITSLIENNRETGREPYHIRKFESGEALLLSQEIFDLLFLDIRLKGIDGIETAKRVRKNPRIGRGILVFVTDTDEYMQEAFDVNAFHYLRKPVDEKKFLEVFFNAEKEYVQRNQHRGKSIFVKANGIYRNLYADEIYYLESDNRKVIIQTEEESISCYGKMGDMERQLGRGFYRCHRGYLVNLAYVREYQEGEIRLTNGRQVLVSKQKRREFVKTYRSYLAKSGYERQEAYPPGSQAESRTDLCYPCIPS